MIVVDFVLFYFFFFFFFVTNLRHPFLFRFLIGRPARVTFNPKPNRVSLMDIVIPDRILHESFALMRKFVKNWSSLMGTLRF